MPNTPPQPPTAPFTPKPSGAVTLTKGGDAGLGKLFEAIQSHKAKGDDAQQLLNTLQYARVIADRIRSANGMSYWQHEEIAEAIAKATERAEGVKRYADSH